MKDERIAERRVLLVLHGAPVRMRREELAEGAGFAFAGMKILEVGCGIGLCSLVLQRRGADITASDYHPLAEEFLRFNAALNGVDNFGGVVEGYFGDAVEVRDSSSNTGIKLGITQRITGDKLTYWNGSSLFESTIPAPQFKYDRFDVKMDLANDTFSLDYYQFTTNTLMTLVTNQPLMTSMNDIYELNMRTSPGIGNDKQNGMNLDDFAFKVVVPEPSTFGALTIAGAAMLMRRRRRA